MPKITKLMKAHIELVELTLLQLFLRITLLPSTSIGYIVKTVQVKVKRIGGAYGSKLNRSASHAMACAFAADKLQKPVRLVLDMATNMQVSVSILYFSLLVIKAI